MPGAPPSLLSVLMPSSCTTTPQVGTIIIPILHVVLGGDREMWKVPWLVTWPAGKWQGRNLNLRSLASETGLDHSSRVPAARGCFTEANLSPFPGAVSRPGPPAQP